MLTERARLLLIVLGVCLILAWYTQFAFIYLISAMLVSILLISLLLFSLTLTDINCTRQLPSAIYEDEIIKVKGTLENRSIFPNYFIYLFDRFPADLINKQEKMMLFPYLPKGKIINWTYEGLCFKRGIYWVGPFTLMSSDPLGLFRKYKIINISSQLTVYPRIFNIHHLPTFMKGIVTPRYGSRTSRRSGEYEEFYGIREYRLEDGLRKIHWPSSAKHNKLIVRHFEQSSVHAITIVLDLKQESNLGTEKETTLEYAVKIAASLSNYFLNQGAIVQFIAYGDKPMMSPFGRDSSHFFTILELLTKAESNSYHSLSQVLTLLNAFIPPNSTLAIIRLDSDTEAAKTAENLIYTKQLSIIEVLLIANTFDKKISEYPTYNIQISTADVKTYQIYCGKSLAASFSQAQA